MLHHPALVQITQRNGQTATVQLFPVYRRVGDRFIATDAFRIFESYRGEDATGAAEDGLARYLQYIGTGSLTDTGYLGEVCFTGETLFEWRYKGSGLNEDELLQVIAFIQSRQPTVVCGRAFDKAMVFYHDNFFVRARIKIIAAQGCFLIYVNERFSALISNQQGEWKVTSGTLSDRGLLTAVLRRIRTYAI